MVLNASIGEIIVIALRSWGLVAAGLGILFIALLVLNALTSKKKDK